MSILGVSGSTVDGAARLRLEQRGRAGRLNGLTSNLRAPMRIISRLPPTNHWTSLRAKKIWKGQHDFSLLMCFPIVTIILTDVVPVAIIVALSCTNEASSDRDKPEPRCLGCVRGIRR